MSSTKMKKTPLFRYHKTLMALFSASLSVSALSSPWLETNDPFLRSSLVLLSDSGQLSSPVNHYPMRWSLFGDDLTTANEENDSVSIANQELSYTLNSARLNRGNRLFKLINASQSSSPSGFGQFNEDERGIYSSFEHLGRSYSYRLSVAYSENQDDTSLNWDDSYIAFNAGAWLWSIGSVDRWWGQGWQHNLILGSYAEAEPNASVSYMGKSKALGVWSVESLLAKPEYSDFEYHSATRLVSKPLPRFEYGVTYQTWFSDVDLNEDDKQLALDAKITLPAIASFYHSVYAEAASTSKVSELGAWLLGWTGAFPLGENTLRIVLESQQSTKAHDDTPWASGSYPSMTNGVSNTTYLLDDSVSIALYLQLKNDHKMGVSYQESTLDNKKTNTSQITYRLPAIAGMVHLGASYEQTKNTVDSNQTNVWLGYEFRF